MRGSACLAVAGRHTLDPTAWAKARAVARSAGARSTICGCDLRAPRCRACGAAGTRSGSREPRSARCVARDGAHWAARPPEGWEGSRGGSVRPMHATNGAYAHVRCCAVQVARCAVGSAPRWCPVPCPVRRSCGERARFRHVIERSAARSASKIAKPCLPHPIPCERSRRLR